jgi:hypothetical protein
VCGVVWCGVVWCGVVWCGVVWCGVVKGGGRGYTPHAERKRNDSIGLARWGHCSLLLQNLRAAECVRWCGLSVSQTPRFAACARLMLCAATARHEVEMCGGDDESGGGRVSHPAIEVEPFWSVVR